MRRRMSSGASANSRSKAGRVEVGDADAGHVLLVQISP
jgi:hypothetical protein